MIKLAIAKNRSEKSANSNRESVQNFRTFLRILSRSFASSRLRRKGFSLIELLLFAAIFAIIAVAFITILVTIVAIQTRQQAAIEVNQQSQFLLQQIQYYIESSSLVELNQDSATSTLKLRMSASSTDPTYIYLSGNAVYLRQTDSGAAQALNSNRVNVSNLNFFAKRSNPPGHDSVSVSFTVAYNTANVQQQFSETLQTAVARVSAATFDSNVIPSSTATYKLGVSGNVWSSVNDIINFSGSNVGIGIGVTSPQQTLEVNGGVRLNTTTARPTCSSLQRGTLWVMENTSATDTLSVCIRSADNVTYYWSTIAAP